MAENFYKEKTAIVTGASSGIGREIAKGLSERGANVVATARRESRLIQLAEECEEYEGDIYPCTGDITREDDLQKIIETAKKISDRIDILINNAALGFNAPTMDIPLSKMREALDTNLLGTMRLTQKVLAEMIEKQRGQIVFVTSLAGKMGFPNLSTYSATKFGVEGFAEAVRLEIISQGIDITVLRPGVTDTEFFEVAEMTDFADAMKRAGKSHPPQDIADFLLDKLPKRPKELTYGRDKWFIKLLPFLPHAIRLKILSLIS